MSREAAKDVATEFGYVANSIYGLYLDTAMATGNLAKSYMDYHTKYLEALQTSEAEHPAPIDPTIVYTAQSEGESKPVHVTTLTALVNRNLPDGYHMQFLGRMCIVALFHYWDDDFRPRLATALGKDPSELTHDAFGDLRYLRRSVIHRQGRAMDECATSKILPRFTPGTELVLDQTKIDQIIIAVRKAALELAESGDAA